MSEKGTVMIDQRLPNSTPTPVLDNAFRQLKEDTERDNRRKRIDDRYDPLTYLLMTLFIVSLGGILLVEFVAPNAGFATNALALLTGVSLLGAGVCVILKCGAIWKMDSGDEQ